MGGGVNLRLAGGRGHPVLVLRDFTEGVKGPVMVFHAVVVHHIAADRADSEDNSDADQHDEQRAHEWFLSSRPPNMLGSPLMPRVYAALTQGENGAAPNTKIRRFRRQWRSKADVFVASWDEATRSPP